MEDRVPTPGQEGRVLITPESGEPFYAKIEMADNPTQLGTPFNKESVLQDLTALLYGGSAFSVPDDIFLILAPLSQYWWRKTVAEGYEEQLTAWSGQMYFMVCDMSQNSPEIQYASSVTINQETGEVSLASPKSVSITVSNRNEVASTIRGKYILGGYSAPTSVIKIDDAAIIGTDYSGSSVYIRVNAAGAYVVTGIASSNIVTLVTSPNRDAYPDNGDQDGATYEYLGNFVKDGPSARMATGTYVGTGRYGESNPNTLTFRFVPKFLMIYAMPPYRNNVSGYFGLTVLYGATSASSAADGNMRYSNLVITWSGNSVSWYNYRSNYEQLNVSGQTYKWLVLA